jgi:hypothetical protein
MTATENNHPKDRKKAHYLFLFCAHYALVKPLAQPRKHASKIENMISEHQRHQD